MYEVLLSTCRMFHFPGGSNNVDPGVKTNQTSLHVVQFQLNQLAIKP